MENEPALSSARARPFRAFLSHRYRSPEINRYFFNLFADEAIIQFTVDRGAYHTNVTRLERFMRDADAFVGIFPVPQDKDQLSGSDLQNESRYFRLELDLAERARKPAIVFIDSDYRDVIETAPSFIQSRFDSQEIAAGGPTRRDESFRRTFRMFRDQVIAAQAYATTQSTAASHSVGILLPDEENGQGYTKRQKEMIKAEVDQTGIRAKILEWPPRLDMGFFSSLEQLDWMIVDMGDASIQTGIVGYLHGRFIPSMRLLRASEARPGADPPAMKTLFGAHEVGYPKDILRWSDERALQEGVRERILRITERREYISNASQADRYFQSAAMRKDGVFVSYTERDGDIASGLLRQIKSRFQEVFDYRDPKSIPPGSNWMEEMFRRLSASAIGIPLLSKQYFESSYCPEEAQRFMDARARKRMHVVPIKLNKEPLDLPEYLQGVQYIRLWEHDNEGSVINELVQRLPS